MFNALSLQMAFLIIFLIFLISKFREGGYIDIFFKSNTEWLPIIIIIIYLFLIFKYLNQNLAFVLGVKYSRLIAIKCYSTDKLIECDNISCILIVGIH